MKSHAEVEKTREHQKKAPGSSTSADAVVGAAMRVLGECRTFVAGLTPSAYSAPSRVLVGGTIGKHLRHTLDHFAAVAPALGGATICYDDRARDVPMEVDPAAGLSEIQRLSVLFGSVIGSALAAAVRVRIMCSENGSEADVGSTLGRELAFATHHAIHHQAMMKAIAIEHGVVLASPDHGRGSDHASSGPEAGVPSGFGIAPSTARHAAKIAGDHSTARSPARAH